MTLILALTAATLAGVLGWKAGRVARLPLRRFGCRLRDARDVVMCRTVTVPVGGCCHECLALLLKGGSPVLCTTCDPVFLTMLGVPPAWIVEP